MRWLSLVLACSAGTAAADVDGKLKLYEQEARQIAQTLPTFDDQSKGTPSRRLVDAQVAFSLGDYDAAAVILFELAGKTGPEQEPSVFYLGETLYAKGDKGAARAYFQQVVEKNNTAGRYYQLSLIRLVEIATAQSDATDVDGIIAALDRATPALPQAAYVKGKWAFSQGKHDEALAFFAAVPAGSSHELQALYYTATVQVAKGDLPRATEAFTQLSARAPKTTNDRRVIELSQLALGRLFYERDQPSKAIDSYLLIDRNSDLFPDALYEVAWVYVKGKQFDKALRALELLALSNKNSNRTATVRILEGNLRIRKGQMNRLALITNTTDASTTDPAIEYDKAAVVFAETHAAYYPSYVALEQMLDSNGDPADYLSQLAERQTSVFQAVAPIPDAAAQYLREEPEVARITANQVDLGTIQAHLTEAETTIARLEAVLASNDKSVVYPALVARRMRIGEIQRDLVTIRTDLAEQQGTLIAAQGSLAATQGTRRQLSSAYTAAPNGEALHSDKVDVERRGYDDLSTTTTEIRTALDQSQAMAVAARKFISDKPVNGVALVTDEQKSATKLELIATAGELSALETELRELKAELTLGRDLAGAHDDAFNAGVAQRVALKAALDAEHQAISAAASSSRDGGRTKKLLALGDTALRISSELQATEAKIESIVDKGLADARELLARERTSVDSYKSELAQYELESRAIGGTILGASFQKVKASFYDVIVRTDVGAIDVQWSQKEDADDDLKRLNLSRSRELKHINDEFKDILDASQMRTPATPTSEKSGPDAPTAQPNSAGDPATGSPDKGPTERVKPGGEAQKTAPAPTVRPDNEAKPAGAKK